MKTFKKNPNGPNELIHGDDFYISYNHKTASEETTSPEMFLISTLASALIGIPNGAEETALFNTETRIWYILNGDFRKQYEEVAHEGFNACLEVYKKNIQHRSDWSTDSPEVN